MTQNTLKPWENLTITDNYYKNLQITFYLH